jgi:4-hydroxy-2-oxoheptanedioate aldolase
VRGARYGLSTDYLQTAHESLLIVPQIETVTAVRNAREIASVDGVDMLFIGPSDLSGSAGVLDQTGAPEVERLIAETVTAVRAAGKPLATVPRDGKSWQTLFEDGFAAVASGSDIAIFRSAAATLAQDWRGYLDRC